MTRLQLATVAVVIAIGRGVVAQPAPTPAPAPAPAREKPNTGYLDELHGRLEIDDCPKPPDLPPDRLAKLPGERFDRGTTLYLNGDYEGATLELIEAYCLSPYFRVLKSIGLAFREKFEFEKAIAYYERYVLTIPPDVTAVDGVAVADEKLAMGARIKVLREMRAPIQVSTTPEGADVTLSGDNGVRAVGVANAELINVLAGRYTMTVEAEGYETETLPIDVRIGKPYSYFFPLRRLRGRLKIRASPPDARILVDGKLVGQGVYDEELPRDSYTVVVEAPGRIPDSRVVEVVAKSTAEIAIELPPPRENGRWQLVIASGVAGASLGGVGLAAGSTNPLVLGVGAVGAATAAVAGGYFGIPDDYPLGSSSFIITAGLAGGGEGLLISQLFSSDNEIASQVAGLGALIGGTVAALTADRFDFSPGDAALVNTGALWGTVMGALFAASYDDSTTRGRQIGAGLTLTGLNVGLLGGILLGRNYEISRRHAALIDLAGVAGAATAAALQGVIDSGEPDVPNERQANFALAGVTAGLLLGAYFTRDMDAAKIPRFKPTMMPIKDAAGTTRLGFGLEGEL